MSDTDKLQGHLHALRLERDQYRRAFKALEARVATLESLEELRRLERDQAIKRASDATQECGRLEARLEYARELARDLWERVKWFLLPTDVRDFLVACPWLEREE